LISRYNERSAVYRVFRRFSGSGGGGQSKSPVFEQRADDAARLYNMAVAHVEKVAAAYEVDAAFFWQPSAFTKSSGEEAARATTMGRLADSAEIHRLATAQVRAPSIDISGVFGNMSEPVYIDWSHTNEVGAAVIASAIYQSILPMLEEASR